MFMNETVLMRFVGAPFHHRMFEAVIGVRLHGLPGPGSAVEFALAR
jgi:hypothetical protein